MKYRTGLVILIFFILFSCSRSDAVSSSTPEAEKAGRPAIAVETAIVSEGSLVPYIDTSGIIRGGSEAFAVLEAQGLIKEVRFQLGDYVEKGDLLVLVDDTLAKSSYQLAEQQYKTAVQDYKAAEKAQARGGLAALELNRAEGRMISAQVNRDRALKAYKDCSLTAPISGYITSKDPAVTVGNLVSPGVRAASIVDTSSYRMEISVGESVVSLLAPGQSAEIRRSDNGSLVTDRAVVQAVAAGSDISTGSFTAVLVWDENINQALPGMTVSATVFLDSGKKELLVPSSALLTRDGQTFVYVEEEGKSVARVVETAGRNGSLTAVIKGLESGEQLILTGLASLAPGNPVISTSIGSTTEVR